MTGRSKSYIFLSYASEDIHTAERLVAVGRSLGFDIWLDKNRLKPGYQWQPAIEAAINNSGAAIFIVSKYSVEKDTFIQEELDLILKEANRRSEEDAFLLPIRLDDPALFHPKLDAFQYLDIKRGDPVDIVKVMERLTAVFHSLIESAARHEDRRREHPADAAMRTSVRTPRPPATAMLFEPDELDLYTNKLTLEAFIFHGKEIEKDIEYLEYQPDDHSMLVYKKNGVVLDLGVSIMWLIRPYFIQAAEVAIVRTKDGETIDGFYVPLHFAGGQRPTGNMAEKISQNPHRQSMLKKAVRSLLQSNQG